ncbi:GNAT family N-acetyltransferase [uncultured Microbulbifer sp.]|uniref:GNAT family N-acetyltransferase n=1 Tax=uncultured Microbulbifer sp. TaxID=348147 RepID=UPI00261ADBF3|nr:GNAT family N-acetyltransferase [uncultured Microbulbifer sp.]
MANEIIKATHELSEEVADLVTKLLRDLVGHKWEIDPVKLTSAARKLLSEESGFHAFLYQVEGSFVGVITISKSAAIYAGGYYGVIEELYVEPEFRSKSIGKALLDETVSFAREQGWPRLEVSTPKKENWQRTIDFYRREGFSNTSVGERLKLEL